MKFICLNKTLEFCIEDSIFLNNDELLFWMERFVPGVSISENESINHKIIIKKSKEKKIEYEDDLTTIFGDFGKNFESSIAKYAAQIFAKLIISEGYILVPGACVVKEDRALLIMGDFWQGKTSIALSLYENFDYDLISDNYIIIKNNKVVCGTKHISIREENEYWKNKFIEKPLLSRNNRLFYENLNSKNEYKIGGIVTCHINDGDQNIHIVSKEESKWFLYGKFSRLYNGEALLFDGKMPSPILNNFYVSKHILDEVNSLLKKINLYYLSTSLDNINKYINNKILVRGFEYNFAIKLTTACPCNCLCCENRKDNFKFKNASKTIFSLDVFSRICGCIKKIGGSYVCLTGGEPTIIPNLTEYIRIASYNGLKVRLNTSGWGITEEKLNDWVDAGLSQIVLSIYSLNEATTTNARGNKFLYERTINAAEIIRKSRKKNNFKFIIQSVIMKDNYLEISDILNFAISNEADMYWPSYLEDATNLENIRLNDDEIKIFKEKVLPRMREIIKLKYKNKNKQENLFFDINQIYYKEYKNYIYHDSNANCPWPGKHFTFYPDGIVDPCPGHEYFKSKYQWIIDYNDIENFFSRSVLEKNLFFKNDYCKYCPQGEHKSINLNNCLKNEHK